VGLQQQRRQVSFVTHHAALKILTEADMNRNEVHEVQNILHLEDGVRSGDDNAYKNFFQEVFSVGNRKDSLDIFKAVAAQDTKDGKDCLIANVNGYPMIKDSVEQKMDLKLMRESDANFEQKVSSFVNAAKEGPLTAEQQTNLQAFLVQESNLVAEKTGGLIRGGSDVVDYINQRLNQEGSPNQFKVGEEERPIINGRAAEPTINNSATVTGDPGTIPVEIRTLTLSRGATPLQKIDLPY
jgi:hypothetical protein